MGPARPSGTWPFGPDGEPASCSISSIRVEEIAKAMIATAKHRPATSATYHYPEMMALIASAQR
jgi:hypothetical protein